MTNKDITKSLGKLIYIEPNKILIEREKKFKSLKILIILLIFIASIFAIFLLIIAMTLLLMALITFFFISSYLMLFIWLKSLEIAKTARLKIFENGFILSIKPKEINVLFSEIIYWKYNKNLDAFKIKLENETKRIYLDNIETRKKFHDVLMAHCKG